jgi:hypothetical protein
LILRYFITVVILFSCLGAGACQCPVTALNAQELARYEIIFRGKIVSVKPCDDRPGEAVFEISELYKGNAEKNFTVVFDCKHECYQQFLAGDEWIIYSTYKQINNAGMDWCSRSRKHFANAREDFYQVNTGVDYDDEMAYLRKELGVHRLLAGQKVVDTGRNERPDFTQSVVILLCSLGAIVVFYLVFNKLFK